MELIPESVALLRAIPDDYLRKLYCHGKDWIEDNPQLGSFVHFALWKELAAAVSPADAKYVELYTGLNVIGVIQRSEAWPDFPRQVELTEGQLKGRAWDIRKSVMRGVHKRGVEEHGQAIWDDA